jgi:AcrR family transcriptional regulator
MAIADRRQREKEQRRTEILEAAERLFFSRGYDDVAMNDIAQEVELNKATLYLYFENKEALFSAIVLRGFARLNRMYHECMEMEVSGITRVGLLGDAYYRFNQQYPDYVRTMRYYGSERFRNDTSPEAAEILAASGEAHNLICSAVQQGIDDGTIRNDLDPMEITLYLMITFMSILSLGEKWIALLDERGISSEAFAGNFLRFIGPAVEARTPPQDAGEDERKQDDRV